MTPAQVQRLILAMTTALPRDWSFLSKPQQEATEATYHRMLADLPYDAARVGVELLLATATRMPTIAEIRDATIGAQVGSVRPGADAWGAVRKAIEGEGAGRRPGVDFVFADSVTARCVDRLGWRELCAGENKAADRSQFVKLYDQLAAELRREQNISALPATRAYRALASGSATGTAAQGLDAMNARSELQAPHRADFNRLLPEGTDT